VNHAQRILLLGCLCLTFLVCSAQSAQRSLLLVAGSSYELGAVTHAELRKVFLGVPVSRDNVRLKPLLNSTDPRATSIFLQQVIFMSEREYRRQLVSRVFRFGDQPPAEHDNIDSLVAELHRTPGSLSFMWSDDFENHEGLESLGVIWTGSGE
jgi:hypothetical protein